jgi:tetratricopeptide (TPR) repeat protein
MKLYKDRLFLGFGLFSGIFSFIIYFLTKAPTVSFWDCGEFIASAKILGVPHPPGTPLFVLIGKFFTILPLPFSDAIKVNLISVISSAATVFVAYWLILRLVIGFQEIQLALTRKLGLAVGALSGSLIMGFGSTYWDNAIEAEVYGAAMFLMLVLCYLTLLWSNRIGRSGSGKYLVAIAYLSFLSIGIHLTAFLIMPVIVIYLLVKDKSLLADYRFVIVWLILLMITVDFNLFFWGLIAAVVLLGIAVFSTTRTAYRWLLAFAIAVAALVGYSNHLYIPIRAAEKPAINENNPDNWDRFKSFLERKQYGQESMVSRMMTRRGSWANQFGTHPHMGFWGFFWEQYSGASTFFIFFALGLWGIYEAVRRYPLNGLMFTLLLIASTIGLLVYLNFSDGKHGAILEVRNRDYFYTPGFMFFAIFIGVSLSSLLGDLGQWISNQSWKKALFGLALIVALLLPVHTLKANYFSHDRSRNWIPRDYAYNILTSVAKDGVLFTNGDNDTFPLWYIQQVEKYRTDVKVVNLSLLNTAWYIHQLKDQMGVPISYSDNQIDLLQPRWLSDQNRAWRVQDDMIKNIVTTNAWKIPIFFALTVPEENRIGLDDNLVQEGMAYRLVASTGKGRVDPATAYERYVNEFKYSGLSDPTIHKDENDNRLVNNYVTGFLQLADTLKNAGLYDKAETVLARSTEIFPNEWRNKAFLAGLYAISGQFEKIAPLLRGVSSLDAERAYVNAGQELLNRRNYPQGKKMLLEALRCNPKSVTVYKNLILSGQQYSDTASFDSLAQSYRMALRDNPSNVSELDRFMKAVRAKRQ